MVSVPSASFFLTLGKFVSVTFATVAFTFTDRAAKQGASNALAWLLRRSRRLLQQAAPVHSLKSVNFQSYNWLFGIL